MAANNDLARLKALSLKSIFWKMVAIYKILHIYLDSVRGLEQFEVLMLKRHWFPLM